MWRRNRLDFRQDAFWLASPFRFMPSRYPLLDGAALGGAEECPVPCLHHRPAFHRRTAAC